MRHLLEKGAGSELPPAAQGERHPALQARTAIACTATDRLNAAQRRPLSLLTLQRKIQVIHPPPPLHRQEQPAAVEAAQDLLAEGLGGVDLPAVGAEDEVPRAEAPLRRHRAARHPADG